MDDLYGPALPPGYVKPDEESSEEEAESTSKPKTNLTKVIGPQRPHFLSEKESELNVDDCSNSSTEKPNMIGPILPRSLQSLREESNDEMLGPLPSQASEDACNINDAKASIEKRAENMRNKLDNKHIPNVDTVKREEWMTTPDTRKNQLGAISRCLVPGSKTAPKEIRSHRHSEKDRQTTEELKKYNKSKRSESLMEMHKKDKKKKDKEKSKKKERTPFDRDEIEVKKFSTKQVNSVIDKAKYLNSRFSAGNNQYL